MNNFIKNRKIITMIICVVGVWFSFCAATVPEKPARQKFVNDFANVLDDETKTNIRKISQNLKDVNGEEIVVVTVESLGGMSIDEYSLELARSWEIGNFETNKGLLICLAIEDRQIKVEVGTGFEFVLNDAKVGRLIDGYAIEYLKNDEWDNGINSLYLAIVTELHPNIETSSLAHSRRSNDVVNSWPRGVIYLIALGIIFLLSRGRRGFRGGSFRGGSSGGGSSGGGSSGGGSFSGGGASRGF